MVAAVGAVAGVAGAAINANAASSASGAQQAAGDRSMQYQMIQDAQNRADQAPFRETGVAANNRLGYLMGLGNSVTSKTPTLTYDQIKQQIAPQYTRSASSSTTPTDPAANNNWLRNNLPAGYGQGYWMPDNSNGSNRSSTWVPGGSTDSSTVDEAGLDAAVRQRLAEQQAQQDAAVSAAQQDPNFGSLTRGFNSSDLANDSLYQQVSPYINQQLGQSSTDLATRADYANSMLHNFGMSDFQADPGYQFRMDEGQKQVENSAAARGGLLSGSALKAIQQYGQNFASNEYSRASDRFNANRSFASNEYSNAFNRMNSSLGNATDAYNGAYNRFNTNNTNIYNRLAGVSGAGQTATNQIGANSANSANQIAQTMQGVGNTQAAGIVGSANALNNGINNFQSYNFMNSLLRNGGGSGYNGATGYAQGQDPLGGMIMSNGWTS